MGSAHGAEGRLYLLVRESFMPMLTSTTDERPIIYRPFKSVTGQALQGLQGKTLGCRKRYAAGDVTPVRTFQDSPPKAAAPEEESDVARHRLVLWSPANGAETDEQGRREVVVDPKLSKILREHQRLGVQFLFDCLMGLRDFTGEGCILADDMGLGKTLQSVSIVWTLLTQGGPNGGPACRKALVVCPASLVKNWASEFDKWLDGRCKYVAVAESGAAKVTGSFQAFMYGRENKVLIVSYETFRGHCDQVADCGIDLVVCDEAHKLKNDDSATTKCIAALPAKRRLLISGTPIQNNLSEFFTLASVANPGVFGDVNEFRRRFAWPILRGREPGATEEERAEAQGKLAEVSAMTDQFILRRTNRLNARFLPPKLLLNVFVAPTAFQRRVYDSFLRSNAMQKLLAENQKMTRTVLVTIKKLQSVVNHPLLLRSATKSLDASIEDEETRALFAQIDAEDGRVREHQRPVHEELSSKFALLFHLLHVLRSSPAQDRVVVISNWTSTLDLVEKMCEHSGWPMHRLDGTMAIGKRMKLVTDFNRPDNDRAFVFLLSSKAGGCGLNLIGANRLVMFDPDWNPANDKQAMARVWRDGQKKKCFIYRLFTSGTIDEKVYQRQICKDGLTTMMVTETGDDEAEMKESLDASLVKDLFSFKPDTLSTTHDMLDCKRCSGGQKFVLQEAEIAEDGLETWSHHLGVEGVADPVLAEAAGRLHAQQAATPRARGAKVSFVMGCHIEFTPEQIARLEQQDQAAQARREAGSAEPPSTPSPAAQAGSKEAKRPRAVIVV